MKKILFTVTLSFFALRALSGESLLWYEKPAPAHIKRPWLTENREFTNKSNPDPNWEKYALPIANGSLGAMIYGSIDEERIQFNEKSVWNGGPGTPGYVDGNRIGAWKAWREVQELMLKGDKKQAGDLAPNIKGTQPYKVEPPYFGRYMTFGEMYIKTGIEPDSVKNYKRQLDLETGIVSVGFKHNGDDYKRRYFASYPDNVIVMQFASTAKQELRFIWDSPHNITSSANNKTFNLHGKLAENGLELAAGVRVLTDGDCSISDNEIVVKNSKLVTFILSADTSYLNQYPNYTGVKPLETTAEWLDKATSKGYHQLLKRHLADYQELYQRVRLNLQANTSMLPTDARVQAVKKGEIDTGLIELHYNFGR
jgi:alpha-L-fucosidase 2